MDQNELVDWFFLFEKQFPVSQLDDRSPSLDQISNHRINDRRKPRNDFLRCREGIRLVFVGLKLSLP